MNMTPIYVFVKVTLVSSRGRYTHYFRIWRAMGIQFFFRLEMKHLEVFEKKKL